MIVLSFGSSFGAPFKLDAAWYFDEYWFKRRLALWKENSYLRVKLALIKSTFFNLVSILCIYLWSLARNVLG